MAVPDGPGAYPAFSAAAVTVPPSATSTSISALCLGVSFLSTSAVTVASSAEPPPYPPLVGQVSKGCQDPARSTLCLRPLGGCVLATSSAPTTRSTLCLSAGPRGASKADPPRTPPANAELLLRRRVREMRTTPQLRHNNVWYARAPALRAMPTCGRHLRPRVIALGLRHPLPLPAQQTLGRFADTRKWRVCESNLSRCLPHQ